jgi:hypothetical protein
MFLEGAWANQETALFPIAMFFEGGQTKKHCFLAMFPEGGTRKHFPFNGLTGQTRILFSVPMERSGLCFSNI